MTTSPLLKCLLVTVGVALMAVSIIGLAIYFVEVGFRLNDTLGWIGVMVGVAGLALAVTGTSGDVLGRRSATRARTPGRSGAGSERCDHVVRDGHGTQSIEGSAINGPVTQIHNWPVRKGGLPAQMALLVFAALAVPAVAVVAGLLGLVRTPVPEVSEPSRLVPPTGRSTAIRAHERVRSVVADGRRGRDTGSRPTGPPSTDRPSKSGKARPGGPGRRVRPMSQPRNPSTSDRTDGGHGLPFGAWQRVLPFSPVHPFPGPPTGRGLPGHDRGPLDLTGSMLSGAGLFRPGLDGPVPPARP